MSLKFDFPADFNLMKECSSLSSRRSTRFLALRNLC